MNYTENVTELLAHARTVDTRRSSPQLPSALGTRLCWYVMLVVAIVMLVCHVGPVVASYDGMEPMHMQEERIELPLSSFL